ncbi:TPA: restriction endonuclease subunit S [Vibrio vulnificus]|nr:restriction endonuclease subunit S [Vibrio vulnificus]
MAYETDKFAFGKLPSDWRCVPLGDLIKSTEYGSSAKSHYSGTIPVLRMGNLQEGKIDWGDLVYTSDESEIKRYRLRNGDVLFNRTNTVDLVGKAAIYKGSRPAIFAGYLIRIIHNETLVDSNYLNYVLNTYQAKKYSKAVLSVAVSQANINAEKLKTYPIPLPPTLEEQTAIVNALSDVDALISELEKLIAKKQAIKTATMQQLLTGKKRLPQFAKNEDGTAKVYKKTELGEIPEDWNLITVLDLARNIIDYRGRTPKKLGMEWGGGSIVALSAGNVKHGYIDFEAECYLGSDALYKRWMTSGEPEKDDIAFTMEAPLGNVALIPDNNKYILSQRTILLQLERKKYLPSFIFQVFMSDFFSAYLSDNATGSTAQGIKRSTFEKVSVVVPSSVDEQEAISKVLSDMDSDIQLLTKRLTKTRQIKQGMMQELLTGKIRLVKPESK